MKNNNTRELNFNFIERQPIATEAYLLLLFGSTDQEKIKEKMLEVVSSVTKICNLLII